MRPMLPVEALFLPDRFAVPLRVDERPFAGLHYTGLTVHECIGIIILIRDSHLTALGDVAPLSSPVGVPAVHRREPFGESPRVVELWFDGPVTLRVHIADFLAAPAVCRPGAYSREPLRETVDVFNHEGWSDFPSGVIDEGESGP